ncbi:hypothetical protein NERG_01317 [Nematocida ausubeli]|uniref:Uncharacterized protein n=1 Tax=Nematocida ausubeli (strain ATCC PRA-371 / ERTm2) TaxID=1913371 RepID=H8ZC74_NEMA1|nr:hypothetical protein NERG_01317 [Nematocida ausubeli]
MHFCITGGSKGLGEALSKYVLLMNHELTIIDKVRPSVKCRYIYHDFVRKLHVPIVCDVLVINHATFNGFTEFLREKKESVDEYLHINLLSHIQLIMHCKYSRLVYINSVLSIAPFPHASLYCASKGFMHNFLESLRRENMNILSVYPYKIDTEMFKEVWSPFALKRDVICRDIYKSIISNDTHLYLPGIFKYAYLYTMLPSFAQDWLVAIFYYIMVRR